MNQAMTYKILYIAICLFFSAISHAQDTLGIKDCYCTSYDSRFDLCSVTIFKDQVFKYDPGYIIGAMLSPWEITKKEQVCYKSPYVSHALAHWSGLRSNAGLCFYTMIFFIKKPSRA